MAVFKTNRMPTGKGAVRGFRRRLSPNQRLGRSVALLGAGHFAAYAVRRHRMAKESEDAEEEELSSVDPTEYTQSVDVATGPQTYSH
jgi:hypothetical protein